MRRLLTLLAFTSCMAAIQPGQLAQARPTARRAAVCQQPTSEQHLRFEGVAICGDIYDFTKVLKKKGYKVVKRMSDQKQFVMSGTVFDEKNCEFTVGYTINTRVVYRVTVRPKNIPAAVVVERLNRTYGQYSELSGDTYEWFLSEGMIMVKVIEGYPPVVVFIDSKGYATYNDEMDQKSMR